MSLRGCIASTLEAVVCDTMHNREEDAGRQLADHGHKDRSGDPFGSFGHHMLVVHGLKVNEDGFARKAASSKGRREQKGLRETSFWILILYPASRSECVASSDC